jgi:FAD-linked sulfhydryl oxidase
MVYGSFSSTSTVQLYLLPLRLCFIHNQVNERLEKPIFDCAHLDDEYDCGCGHDSDAPTTLSSATKDELTGADLIRGGR